LVSRFATNTQRLLELCEFCPSFANTTFEPLILNLFLKFTGLPPKGLEGGGWGWFFGAWVPLFLNTRSQHSLGRRLGVGDWRLGGRCATGKLLLQTARVTPGYYSKPLPLMVYVRV